jgi:hypothetical protein
VDLEETTGEAQQQQGNANWVSAAGRCSTPISFLNVYNYESLFIFGIVNDIDGLIDIGIFIQFD